MLTAGPWRTRWMMRFDLQQLQTEILPLADVHGVEVVAIEWLQGPGRGVLRVYIDRPGRDPAATVGPGVEGATADVCARFSRDVSAALDALDVIPAAYDLEVSSPGFERPVQKRADFERFSGRVARVRTRSAVMGRLSFVGALRGTIDLPDGDFAVRIAVDATDVEVPARVISRAHLVEIKTPRAAKPGKGPGKQQREKQGVRSGVPPTGPAVLTTETTETTAPPWREARAAGEAER